MSNIPDCVAEEQFQELIAISWLQQTPPDPWIFRNGSDTQEAAWKYSQLNSISYGDNHILQDVDQIRYLRTSGRP